MPTGRAGPSRRTGAAVDVQVFESPDLPAHWPRLDEFEGPGYERVLTTVHLAARDVGATNYVLSSRDDDGSTPPPRRG